MQEIRGWLRNAKSTEQRPTHGHRRSTGIICFTDSRTGL